MTDVTEQPKVGRKRDPSRDADILDAALEVLAESGYDGLTMDKVALRAKAGKATVYRRWSSKEEMVLDAVARMGDGEVDPAALPDTGTLRGDLVGLMQPQTFADEQRRLQVMAGLMSALAANPKLAETAHAVSAEPWVVVNRILLQRALDRGEIPPSSDIDTLSEVIPSMATYRVTVQRKPMNPDFLMKLLDGVVLPAVGIQPPAKPTRRR